jgi:hypothetical protein
MNHGQQNSSRTNQRLHPLHRPFMKLHPSLYLGQPPRLTDPDQRFHLALQQAHISNFLNRKRALSLEGLDRVLASQNLTIDQILPLDLAAATPVSDPTEVVPVVSASVAMDDAHIPTSAIIETIQVSASRLHDNRSRPSTKNAHWQRFLAIRADAQQSAAMDPLLSPGAIAVLDRHYNSLAPYRAHQPTLYAVRTGAALLLRFVDFDEGRLIFSEL